MTTARCVTFTAPGQVEIRSESLPPPGPGEALVQTLASGISAGTELLILRGQAPPGMTADESLPSLTGTLDFPLKYGYAAAGKVIALGPQTDMRLNGSLVFAFYPHQSHFIAPVESLLVLPADLPAEHAVLLPNLETAVALVHDGRPAVGEQAAVFGQGIVGLLTTALLSRMPLQRLLTFDRHPARRQTSLDLGADASLEPASADVAERTRELLSDGAGDSAADLCFELTGDPQALDQAIAICGFDGRVIIGSWYGRKRASLDLGGRFHRSRIRLISSQVSTIDPALRGRWDHRRRLRFAQSLLPDLPVERLISHRVPFEQAAEAYHLLDQQPGQALQVVLIYDETPGG